MKRIISIAFVLVLAFACITPVYATEVADTVTYTFDNELFPDLEVESKYTDLLFLWNANGVYRLRIYDVLDYEHLVLYPNSSKYGYLWCEGINGYELVEYSLRDGTWRLDNTVGWPNDTYFNFGSVSLDSVVYTSADIRKSYTTDSELLFAANYDIETGTGTGNIPEEPEENPEDTNDSWDEEDKGWLGSLFSDLKDLWNNLYSRFVTFLENLISTLTSSVGNFITSATSSISTFINNAVSSISGFIDGVISVINSVSASVGEWIAGVVSEIQAIYIGITDFLVSLWSDMWIAISEFFENLFKDITDYFAEKKAETEAVTEAFTSFFDSIIMLFEAVFDYSYEESGGAVNGNA